ncbi:MAG: ABC transporter ATP-binding protein [Myxococcota bacterium]
MMDLGFDLAGRRDPRLFTGLLFASLGAILEAVPLGVAVWVLEALLVRGEPPLSTIALVLILLACLVGAFIFKIIGGRLNFSATYDLVGRTRLRLIEHLRKLPMGAWNQRRLGSTVSVLTDEFSLYTEIVTHSWGLVVANIALPVVIGIVLMFSDWRLGALALLPVPLALLAIPWSFRLVNRAADRAFAEKQAAVDLLVEYVRGIESLRDLEADRGYRARIEAQLHTVEREMMRAELLPAPAIMTFSMLVFTGFTLCFGAGAYWLVQGELEVARFFAVAMVALHFARTLSQLVLYLAMARHAARTLERIRALFDEPVQSEGKDPLQSGPIELEVHDLSFAYEDETTLQGVDAAFPVGSLTALVGPSGSGKSTLAHLLMRLWDVDAGRVTMNGLDVRDLTLQTVQSKVATVFQDVVLFQETVAENIKLGRPEASARDVEEAARTARAHDFIMELPQGYDTVLGPNGASLSGGQRQRLSIARALLKNAPILVLDEATASVDPYEESLIQEAIGALMEGRTVIVVAHRLWTIQGADQILVLDGGRVVERGPHEALVEAGGAYQHLWETQMENRQWRV